MLCPLKKVAENTEFGQCYEGNCEWWIYSDEEEIGGCAIKYMGLSAAIYISGSSKEEEQ
jgi:hypothetical protein